MQWVARGAAAQAISPPERRAWSFALLCGAGQLGNQMFEAAFADRMLPPGARVFSLGLGELLEGCDWPHRSVGNLGLARRHRRAQRWVQRFGKLAVRLRLIDGISQLPTDFVVQGRTHRMPGDTLQYSRGVFPRLLFIDRGYYQDGSLGPQATFRPKPIYLTAARDFLAALPPGPRVFVHIRRGDYRRWSPFGCSPLLDLEYFRKGMTLIRAAHPATQFVLLSDEVEEMTRALADDGMHPFQGASVHEDFGMMTMCDGAVISNSTLSWWGAWRCARTLPVVAPRGFVAVGLGFSYPPSIAAEWLTEIDP